MMAVPPRPADESPSTRDDGAYGGARLREISNARQPEGDPPRRWFSCASADLFVWSRNEGIVAFEFCYGKPDRERSLRWRTDTGFRHACVDDGESSPLRNRTPIAIDDDDFDLLHIAHEFMRVAKEIDPAVARFVLARLYE